MLTLTVFKVLLTRREHRRGVIVAVRIGREWSRSRFRARRRRDAMCYGRE